MKEELKEDGVDLQIILNSICEYFKIENKIDVFNTSRKGVIIQSRQWFQYFARELNPEYKLSLNYIGKFYFDKTNKRYNHATVLSNYRKIKGYILVSKPDQATEIRILNIIKRRLEMYNDYEELPNEDIELDNLIKKYKKKLEYTYSDKQLIAIFIRELEVLKSKQYQELNYDSFHKL